MPALTSIHEDALGLLNRSVPLAEKVRAVHDLVRQRLGDVDRVAAALYDPRTDLLKAFLDSGPSADRPLRHYQARLRQSRSLRQALRAGRPRVVNDLTALGDPPSRHTRRLLRLGYRSSYTLPVYSGGALFGCLFFDSRLPGRFTADSLRALDVFAHLLALVILHDVTRLRTLACAVRAARDLTRHRDAETGRHLDRMAYYARLVARQLAPRHGLSEAYVEQVFLFAPLHDVGKIGLPDRVLHKQGPLTAEEFELVKAHPGRGCAIVDALVATFGLGDLKEVWTLRNLVAYHHEALDGSGYPEGLAGGRIPLEARIVAVADVFDALTSRRPYKAAWGNDEAFGKLRELAGTKLDPECVAALVGDREEVEEIQRHFREDFPG
jgi:HD-GYP domain-containing protein (c-di-GMP phosphodiesterase class II)